MFKLFSAKGWRTSHREVSIVRRTNQGSHPTSRIAVETDASEKTSKEILKQKKNRFRNVDQTDKYYFLLS